MARGRRCSASAASPRSASRANTAPGAGAHRGDPARPPAARACRRRRPNAAGYWREDRDRRGDTIGSVLARLGVDDPAALEFLRTESRRRAPLYQLRPGKPLSVETDDDGRLIDAALPDRRRRAARRSRATATRSSPRPQPAPAEIRWKMATGEIRSSLFGAADAAGLPDAVTLQLADVFARRHRLLSRPAARRPLHRRLRDALRRRRAGRRRAHRRRRVRQPRPDASRVPVARRRRQRELLRGGRRRRCGRRSCARRWSSRA